MTRWAQWLLAVGSVAACSGCFSVPPVYQEVGRVSAAKRGIEVRVRTESQSVHCEFPVVLYLARSARAGGAADFKIQLDEMALVVSGGENGLYNREVFRADGAPEQQGPWATFRLPSDALPTQPFSIWSGTECEIQLSAPLPPSRGNEVPRVYPFIRVEPS